MEAKDLKLNIDVKQILSVLSSSLYKGDVLEVATRELLQNAFDAVKTSDSGIISFKWDDECRCLTVRDNGCGMSPTTVREVFFTVGGTLKEGLDVSERSGGFGIAKVQFFMAADHYNKFFEAECFFRNLLFEVDVYTDLQAKFSALYLQYSELLNY